LVPPRTMSVLGTGCRENLGGAMSGIFGFIGRGNAFAEVRSGLENLSHRGQESWGIVSARKDGSFLEARGVGQVRYPTAGETNERNSQPIVGSFGKEKIAVVHNGHIPGYKRMVEELGGLFQTETDTEVILQEIARMEGEDLLEKMEKTLRFLGRQAAFSIIILHDGKLIAARDPFGFRPLSIARRGEEGDYAWALASETCAFHGQFEWIGDVEPGQMVVLDGEDVRTIRFADPIPIPALWNALIMPLRQAGSSRGAVMNSGRRSALSWRERRPRRPISSFPSRAPRSLPPWDFPTLRGSLSRWPSAPWERSAGFS